MFLRVYTLYPGLPRSFSMYILSSLGTYHHRLSIICLAGAWPCRMGMASSPPSLHAVLAQLLLAS